MAAEQATLFEAARAPGDDGRARRRQHRESFLAGLLAGWLAGSERKPTREEREQAERAAQAALDTLLG